MTDLAAVVLAAGSGTRLRPLTDLLPKALCPVNNVALVDHAIGRAKEITDDIAVNTWHQSEKVIAHLEGKVHLSVEESPLGTAGALGNLGNWLDGRSVVVQNADAWHRTDLTSFLRNWDGTRPRLLVTEDRRRGDFGRWRFCGVSVLPWNDVAGLRAEPSGLYELLWARQFHAGQLEFVALDGPYFDCGTPADYLGANLVANGGQSVIGEGCVVDGSIERCVLWPGVHVASKEHLSESIRATDDITIDARAGMIQVS